MVGSHLIELIIQYNILSDEKERVSLWKGGSGCGDNHGNGYGDGCGHVNGDGCGCGDDNYTNGDGRGAGSNGLDSGDGYTNGYGWKDKGFRENTRWNT